MENIKLEAGKFYRTRDGRRAYVASVCNPFKKNQCEWDSAVGWVESNGNDQYRDSWSLDGRAAPVEHCIDLVAEWVEPKRIKGWICVWDFPGALVVVHPSEQAAKEATMGERNKLAIVFIDLLEGQGLDGSAHHG